MRIYKVGSHFIAIHTKGNYVYSAQGSSENEAKERVIEMINKKE